MINSKLVLASILSFLFMLISISCKKSIAGTQSDEISVHTDTINTDISKTDIKNLKYVDYVLSEASTEIITDWAKFFEIQAQIDVLKNANLSFFNDNSTALISLLEDFKNDIPSALNDTIIIVRLKVIESLFYRLEDMMNYNISKEETINQIKDILIANSNLIDQINKKVEKDQQNIINPY